MAEAAADYGLDAPLVVKRMFTRGAWTLALALALYFVNRAEYPGPAGRLLGVLGSIGVTFLAVGAYMIWSSRVGKLGLRDQLIDSLDLKGDEKVLDVGCGRGLMLIGAAKRLKTGKATGVDLWSTENLSGNSAEAVKENAKLEGVADRVRIETFDARKLPYPDNNYDVVLSSLAIHNIPEREERDQAIREMVRVLRPNGRLLIFDILHTGDYAKLLRESGAKEVSLSGLEFLWCMPARSVKARK